MLFGVLDGSTEEHRYVGSLAKEKKAFEQLIDQKSHMVISLPDHRDDLMKEKLSDVSIQDSRAYTSSSSSSSALLSSYLKPRKLVIDVREFRSTLPAILHTTYFQLIPRTLNIGDYILSPEICVERKGISDLFQSFASGRLYNQVEAMSKYYKFPCLLIEFTPDKPFCFNVRHSMFILFATCTYE
jgi:DNA excision repair protein ERCC-4